MTALVGRIEVRCGLAILLATALTLPAAARSVAAVSPVATPNAAASVPTAAIQPLPPKRVLDTRPDGPRVGYIGKQPGAAATVEVSLGGTASAGVPADAEAVFVNLTATDARTDGFITVWPCGQTRPATSSLNVGPGAIRAALVTTKLGPANTACVYTQSGAHLIVDVVGYAPHGSGFVGVVGSRLLDTRTGGDPVGSKVVAGQAVELAVTGGGGVPDNAAAVAVNVTATGADADAYVTVWPCGNAPRPLASHFNIRVGATTSNVVISRLATSGHLCVYTQESTHIVVDLLGYFTPASGFVGVTGSRALDTRPGRERVGFTGSTPAAGQTIEVKVGDDNGGRVPVDAQTVLLNVTGVDAASDGFVTVWPCGTDRPLASTINLMHGQTVANLTVSRLGPGGRVCVYTQSSANLVVDVFGYFGGAPTTWTSPPPLTNGRAYVRLEWADPVSRMATFVVDPCGLAADATPLARGPRTVDLTGGAFGLLVGATDPRVNGHEERTTFEHWLDVVTRSMPPSALPMQLFVDPGVPFVTTLSRGFDLCSPVGG